MNTELILDGAYKIPKAKIYAAEMDAEVRRAVALLEGGGTVSYTHLTLPTTERV